MSLRSLGRLVERPTLWIVGLWAVAVAARLIRAGTVYGLDYSLFHPDGTLYHTLTLRLLGEQWSEVSTSVAAFYSEYSLRGLPADWRIDASVPGVGIVYTRPLYSLLSVPFVAVAGQWGMLAVPSLSLLAVGLSLLAMGRRMHAEWPAVLVFGGLTFSTTVMRWSVSNLTDSLQFGLVAAACALLAANRDRLWLLLPVGAGLLTRPSGPIWVALLLPFALRQRDDRRKLLAVMALALASTVAVILYSPATAGLSLTDPGPVMQRLLTWTWYAAVIPVAEIGQLAVLDRLLLAMLVGTAILALRGLDNVWSQAFLAVLMTTMVMGAWVGVIGVNFRYQLPCLIPAGVVLMRAARSYVVRVRSATEPRGTPTHRLLRSQEPAAPFHPRAAEDTPSGAPAVARKAVTAR